MGASTKERCEGFVHCECWEEKGSRTFKHEQEREKWDSLDKDVKNNRLSRWWHLSKTMNAQVQIILDWKKARDCRPSKGLQHEH